MHNLALALHHKGYIISGSDDVIFEPSKSRLDVQGLLPEAMGWDPARISRDLDAVILGMHAKPDNPELLKAQELDLKIYSYPEFLYEQSREKTRVVIGGSHGKTSITSMILHVLNYHNIEVDYMVGAQLEGFDRMVHLTEDNDFIVLEGDEYLSSPIDRRPKFHLYKPHIALLSGIAWDHINVFPTYENYLDQFRIFLDLIVEGGSITYNEEDEELARLVEQSANTIRKIPYATLEYQIDQGQTFLETREGPLPVEIFGRHNVNNLSGAKWICQHMGVDEDDFYEAISSFSGASKRLELVAKSDHSYIYKDFAHSPSKVEATTKAVREQYPDKNLITCLELHTYSSLNAGFLELYKDTLHASDSAVVFYSPEALRIKRLEAISPSQIGQAFNREDLVIFTEPERLREYLDSIEFENTVLLFMSSGNYGGLDLENFKDRIRSA